MFCVKVCVLFLDCVHIYVSLSFSSLSLNQLTSQLDHQEQGISSLHEVIPGQLSIDPTVLSEVIIQLLQITCNCLSSLY